MDTKEIVNKIKNKQPLGENLINNLIKSYCDNKISDDEILPIIKAIYDNDISDQDLFYLTDAMKNSGHTLNLQELGQVVDKHSTGGVSDTTTIILVPICAVLGTKMLKLSGRGLGFTGGTCDKLEAFSGYKTDIDLNDAISLVKENGGCMMTSSLEIAPADKKIYSLRNKTGLVDNVSLIASSIMSKKLASGADIIVLDVKYGNGAFMPNLKMAKKLGKKMQRIGQLAGKKIKIVYGKMSQPLGYNIGPKLETMEAIKVLDGKEKGNLYKDSVRLASLCVALDKHIPYLIAKHRVIKTIKNKTALEKLKIMVKAQGGSLELFNEEYATPTLIVKSNLNGKVVSYNTKDLGEIVCEMGTNARNSNDKIDYNLGVITTKKIGGKVKINDEIFKIYAKDLSQAKDVEQKLLNTILIK